MLNRKQIYDQALTLSPTERAELIDDLLASLDDVDRATLDALWANEALSRLNAYGEGRFEAIDAEAVHESLEKWLKEQL